jgi:hypothetical protein
MLSEIIVSVVISLGLIAFITLVYRPMQSRGSRAVAFAVTALAFLFGCMGSLPLMLQAVSVIPIWWLCRTRQLGATSLLALMVLAMGLSYGYVICVVIFQVAEYRPLLPEYPLESMEARVPAPQGHSPSKLTKESDDHLSQLQTEMENSSYHIRTEMLRWLHQASVESFIKSPGFGASRRIRPSAERLKINDDRYATTVTQPVMPFYTTLMDGDLLEAKNLNLDPLRELHLASVIDFTNPSGFGWIVDRRNVAGFQSHQFSKVPKVTQWKVETIELVGLLLHGAPVVYISETLPAMKKGREYPTRPLNVFEQAALKRLQVGEDLYIRETPANIRMIGALRSATECVRCHGGERGDLLGAFSYSLKREQ